MIKILNNFRCVTLNRCQTGTALPLLCLVRFRAFTLSAVKPILTFPLIEWASTRTAARVVFPCAAFRENVKKD